MVHGEAWTIKEFFTYPNEYIYWTIQIVMYPFMTGLVAGAFVLSSLYHVFGVKQLKGIARFSLVFSFALLPVAMLPLLMHLQQPLRGIEVMLTPHFTSAIAAFGIVFSTYGMIVASELWFVFRKHFVETALALKAIDGRTALQQGWYLLFSVLTLGAWDISHEALEADERAVKKLAGAGIPVACFLHGYAGFIFGSVKANALWMTPLMPVIFICSAVVSGIALCILTYILTMEIRKQLARRHRLAHPELPSMDELKSAEAHVVAMTSRYLLMFMVAAITLELLDLIFRGYTAVKSWDILRSVIYERDFVNIFVVQYGLGNLVPFVLFLIPGLTIRRAVVGTMLVLLGVFMMRWNVVIGGQAFSSSFSGFMHYVLPLWPDSMETLKEGLVGALIVAGVPFCFFYLLNKVMPVFKETH
ncbi:NrfD/PsrC family molybdoenzyme membrane anchor subunit [Geomonas azotofigens]|uniref:NrfD/PsrC family molybdoenzyme membrane anchor subunit n=1 Tax=Geomonas azotofigens TaxID=2843196 RepID=UPI001C10C3C1|nr:NrfD/PsrC family molybdoenzyme membrane anchor subunit [Geomonas azotofigens]MBU5613187.1 polysulfide reductase NrfD [Geomonas azotofigens]